MFQSLVGSGVYCDGEVVLSLFPRVTVSIPSREWSLLRLRFHAKKGTGNWSFQSLVGSGVYCDFGFAMKLILTINRFNP